MLVRAETELVNGDVIKPLEPHAESGNHFADVIAVSKHVPCLTDRSGLVAVTFPWKFGKAATKARLLLNGLDDLDVGKSGDRFGMGRRVLGAQRWPDSRLDLLALDSPFQPFLFAPGFFQSLQPALFVQPFR
jgi:hypothetical protein